MFLYILAEGFAPCYILMAFLGLTLKLLDVKLEI